MPAMTTFPVHDPWSRETPQAEHLGELRQFNQRCYALVKKVLDRNQAAGKKGKEIFWVYGIMRARPECHVIFNLAMKLDKYEIFPLDLGVPEYSGAMGCAETLLGGAYRIASIEEEAECIQRDIKAREAKLAQRRESAGLQLGSALGEMAKKFMGPLTPAPAAGKGR